MPAKSKKQQKPMGLVRSVQKGEQKAPSKKISKIAKSMSKKDAKKFASTKHKGLPERVKSEEVDEEIENEMSSVGGVAGYQGPGWYHGDHVNDKQGVYKSDIKGRESKYPRKKGKQMVGSGPQGDKHFSKYEAVKSSTKVKLNEFISKVIADDLLNTDMTPEATDRIGNLQKQLSKIQVDINSSFTHAQEFLKLGQKTHREIEFKRLAVEAKRLSNLVTKYKNLADQLAAIAGDINHRQGTKELYIKMQKQSMQLGGEE